MKPAKKVHLHDDFCPLCHIRVFNTIISVDNRFDRSEFTLFMKRVHMKRMFFAFLITIMFLFTGCAAGGITRQPQKPECEENTAAESEYRIAYLCSDGSNDRLSHIANSIRKTCEAMEIEYVFLDCKNRDDLFLSFLKDLEISRLDALIVSPTNEGLGPMVTSKCEEIGIPVLCIESRLKTIDGKNAAYIGASAYDNGMLGGQELVDRANKRGFFDSKKSINVILLSRSNFFYEDQTMQGFRAAFSKLNPELSGKDYLTLETYHSSFSSQYLDIKNQLKTLDQDNLYIGVSYNDEGALALYCFAQESGIDMSDMLICGIGGYEPSYEIFKSGGAGAKSYICVGVDPFDIGEKAVNSLYAYINKGEVLPEIQTVEGTLLTEVNYEEYYQEIYVGEM